MSGMDVSAATWNTLSKLLDAALDLEPGARAAWIEDLSVTQPDLAPVLRKLLAAMRASKRAISCSDCLRSILARSAPATRRASRRVRWSAPID